MSAERASVLTAASGELPLYQAEDLTRGGVQALIRLGDRTYTLRITRAGKLILTR
jgi:hemin uptake protein HemP